MPTDYQPDSQAAYRLVAAMARGSGATVTLLHVFQVPIGDEYHGLDAIRLLHAAAEPNGVERSIRTTSGGEIRARALERLRAEVPPDWVGAGDLRLEVRCGEVVEEIARYVTEAGVDLIVTTGSRPGFLPTLGRDMASQLARATPVEIVRVTPPPAK